MSIAHEYGILRERLISGDLSVLEKKAPQVQSLDLVLEPDKVGNLVTTQLVDGGVAAMCLGAVYALVSDARDPEAVLRVREVKERYQPDKRFAVMMSLADLRRVVDMDGIARSVRSIFEGDKLERLFGGRGFLRVPVRKDLGLPERDFVSEDGLQVFSFVGDAPAYAQEVRMRDGLAMRHMGWGETLVTSFNLTGSPSITNPNEARLLAGMKGLDFVVNRADSPQTGSYSIYRFNRRGVDKVRHGTGASDIDAALANL